MDVSAHKQNTPTINAVDLFCGAGGLTCGLMQAGVMVKAGVDCEEACRFPYEHNNGVEFVGKSVLDLSGEELSRFFDSESLSLLCGCAPCQTFSSLNQKDESEKKRSSKWTLLDEFSRLAIEMKPDYISMENVPGLIRQDVFRRFLQALESSGYFVDYKIVDCSEYGAPQRRKRLVLIAAKASEIAIPRPDTEADKVSVRATIGSLPRIAAGETDENDPLHSAAQLSELNLRRIKSSREGGTWRDWANDLRLKCHMRKSGNGYGAVYGRMSWDSPSPTITTQFYNYGSGRFGHPEQDRAISLREGALLQGFPIEYVFSDHDHPIGRRMLGTLIGNAVPVQLGHLVGRTVIAHAASVRSSN